MKTIEDVTENDRHCSESIRIYKWCHPLEEILDQKMNDGTLFREYLASIGILLYKATKEQDLSVTLMRKLQKVWTALETGWQQNMRMEQSFVNGER